MSHRRMRCMSRRLCPEPQTADASVHHTQNIVSPAQGQSMHTPNAVTVKKTHRVARGAAARRAASSLTRPLHCDHSWGRAAQLANAVIVLTMAVALVRRVHGTVIKLCVAVMDACMPFAATATLSASRSLQLRESISNGQQLLAEGRVKKHDAVCD